MTGLDQADEIVSKVGIALPGRVTVTFDEDGTYAVLDVEREAYIIGGYLSDRGVVETIIERIRSILSRSPA
jgi:hypothetical protein